MYIYNRHSFDTSVDMHQQTATENELGAQYYGKALTRLSKNLQDPIRWMDPVNVAATQLLSIYEVIQTSIPLYSH